MNLLSSVFGIDLQWILQVLAVATMTVVFVQSGLDKVIDREGNMAFIKSHFENTFLGKTPTLNYLMITILELSAGFVSLLGLGMMLIQGKSNLAIMGLLLACISLIVLITGQRIAKDYEGSATLMSYLIVAFFGLSLFL